MKVIIVYRWQHIHHLYAMKNHQLQAVRDILINWSMIALNKGTQLTLWSFDVGGRLLFQISVVLVVIMICKTVNLNNGNIGDKAISPPK